MVKIFNYILLFHFSLAALIPMGDLNQLAKVGNLLAHYKVHQTEAVKQNKTVNFTNFLYVHFIDSDEHQHSDKNQHEDLPFKSITASNFLFFESPQVEDAKKVILNSKLQVEYSTQFIPTGFLNSVFRPPSHLII